MLIWGSGGKAVDLGVANQAYCPVCEKERSFKNVLAYRYAHIWYLFRWVTKKSYSTVCEICGRGTEHDPKAYEAKHGKAAIPAFYRYGGWALLALIVAFVSLVAIAGISSDKREAKLLQQPQVGDLYSVRLDKFVPDDFDGIAYGIMRVSAVDGRNITLAIPNQGYSKMKDVSKDLRSEVGKPGYFSDDSTQLPLDEINKRHDASDIYDVKR